MLEDHRDSLVSISELLLERETIESQEFEALLAGKSAEEVFGPDDTPAGTGDSPADRPELPEGAARPSNPLLPRPGLAAEARGLDFPEKPELA
jgi:cell division protease FtsH